MFKFMQWRHLGVNLLRTVAMKIIRHVDDNVTEHEIPGQDRLCYRTFFEFYSRILKYTERNTRSNKTTIFNALSIVQTYKMDFQGESFSSPS